MREIYRIIASALIFSKDSKLLLWKKDPKGGGVYLNYWHIPWWGVDEGETLEQAVIREVKEEVWLNINETMLEKIPFVETGSSEKILKNTKEKVICHMEFHRFKVDLPLNADEIQIFLWDDLVEVKWFDSKEILTIEQVPWGEELLRKIWFIK